MTSSIYKHTNSYILSTKTHLLHQRGNIHLIRLVMNFPNKLIISLCTLLSLQKFFQRPITICLTHFLFQLSLDIFSESPFSFFTFFRLSSVTKNCKVCEVSQGVFAGENFLSCSVAFSRYDVIRSRDVWWLSTAFVVTERVDCTCDVGS